MCNDAIVFRADGGRVLCETQGELADALKVNPPILPGYKRHLAQKRDVCLCPVDFQKLGKATGAKIEAPDYDDGSDHWDSWAIRLPA